MESHQDFRSLQAKFQASQSQPGQLPGKTTLKPEFNKLLKKFPQPELSDQLNKSLQPEFSVVSLKPLELQVADLPKKALQPELIDLKKLPQPEVTSFPKKPPQPEFSNLPKKPPQPEFSNLPKKPPQPEFSNLPKKPPQPEFSNLPKKPPQPEFSNLPKKPPQPEFSNLPKKPPQPEFSNLPQKPPKPEFGEFSKKSLQLEAPQKVLQPEPLKPALTNPARSPLELKPSAFPSKFWKPESSETPLRPSQFEFPKKPLQPQADGLPKKSLTQSESSEVTQTPSSKSESSEPYPNSPQPDFSTLPQKSPQQPELYEVPQTPPWKRESCDPQPHSPQPGFAAFPTKHPQFQLSDLTRTSSEPKVCIVPNKPRQPEFKVFSKPLKPELGHLPRTSSEPEFSSLPRKFVQPERRGQPRNFSQPELKKPLQSEFKESPRKLQLPGSVSESSLPTAILGSSPRFGVIGTPRWRSDFQVPRRPQRRPLPSASSLGSPPAKPPLPPGPINIQSFWRASAGATAVQRTHSSAGTHFQAQQSQHILQNPDEIYELYDAMEPTDDSCPSPRGRDQVQSIQQATRKPQQDSELRKEKATQAQQLPPMDTKLLKQIRKAEKAEREFRKKFKFEGEIVIHTRMMIDPNAKTRRGGGKHLGIRRGEILEVIEFTSKDEILCRDPKGKYGYVPRIVLLPLETEVYDDVGFWDPLESQPFPQGQ